MPADLDARIRGLVVEVVEHAPPAPDLDLAGEPREVSRRRPGVFVALAIGSGVAVAMTIGAIALVPGREPTTPAATDGATVTIPLDSIPEGVSARRPRGVPVFLVRDGGDVTVFLSQPRLPGFTRMWWCPRGPFFFGPRHGERFDITGRVFAGPAPRGLDRFRVRARDGVVTVQLNRVVHDDRPRGTDLVRNVDDRSCDRRLVAGQERRELTLPLEAIPPGTTFGRVGPRRVFFVRHGKEVTVLVRSSRQLQGVRTWIAWCPTDGFLYSPTHGEKFDQRGTGVAGPVTRDLDRLRARIKDGLVAVDARDVVRGRERAPLADPSFQTCRGEALPGP